MRRKIAVFLTVVAIVMCSAGCTVKLDGSQIPLTMKTINIEYFENDAPLVVNYLSQQFTESIKSRIRSSTSLSIVQGEAHANMSGSITGYTIEPISVQATNTNTPPIAGAERLSITVNVIFTNTIDKKLNFTQAFTEHADFTGDISSQEQNLITTINKALTDDIFNRAFANW